MKKAPSKKLKVEAYRARFDISITASLAIEPGTIMKGSKWWVRRLVVKPGSKAVEMRNTTTGQQADIPLTVFAVGFERC